MNTVLVSFRRICVLIAVLAFVVCGSAAVGEDAKPRKLTVKPDPIKPITNPLPDQYAEAVLDVEGMI